MLCCAPALAVVGPAAPPSDEEDMLWPDTSPAVSNAPCRTRTLDETIFSATTSVCPVSNTPCRTKTRTPLTWMPTMWLLRRRRGALGTPRRMRLGRAATRSAPAPRRAPALGGLLGLGGAGLAAGGARWQAPQPAWPAQSACPRSGGPRPACWPATNCPPACQPQIINTACWQSSKECGLLLGALARALPIGGELCLCGTEAG